MFNLYDPTDHYGKKANGTIYSSKTQTEIDVTDEAYINWLSQGKQPTSYPVDEFGMESKEELSKILKKYDIQAYKLSFEESKKAKLAELFTTYQKLFEEVDKIYPQPEREGGVIQEAEAAKLLSNPESTNYEDIAPVLNQLIKFRNKKENIFQLAQKVIDNATIYRGLYALYTGQQQRMYQEISEIYNQTELNNYQIKFVTAQELQEGYSF